MKNVQLKNTTLLTLFLMLFSGFSAFASHPLPPKALHQDSFTLVYLSIKVTQRGRTKIYKSPNITGSKSKVQRNVRSYIEKYVPDSDKAKCTITLTQMQVNKTISGREKNKNVSGDGATIHQNMSSVVKRLW